MNFSMTGQEKGDLLIQVTTWAGLTVHFLRTKLKFCRSIIIERNTVKHYHMITTMMAPWQV
jgi:hypothetical protein